MVPSFAGRNNLFRILAPAEGTGALAVVGLQILVHGIHQILQGGEVTALQAAPRQFGEETLHRIHPGAGGGYEVKVPVGVRVQPGMHIGSLRRGVVVQDHMHGGAGGAVGGQMIQKGQELLLAMPGLRLGGDLSGLHVQRGAERGGAMPDVIMGLGGGMPRPQGQAGLGALQGLNLGLCVYGQHQGLRRRLHIQAHHLPRLAGEVGVRRDLELATAVRGPPLLAPDAVHRGVVQAYCLRQAPAGPVRCPVGRRLQSAGQHRLHLLLARRGLARRPRAIVQQALHSSLHLPILPAPHRDLALAGAAHNLHRAQALRSGQHDGTAPHMFLWGQGSGHQRLQALAILGSHLKVGQAGHGGGSRCRGMMKYPQHLTCPPQCLSRGSKSSQLCTRMADLSEQGRGSANGLLAWPFNPAGDLQEAVERPLDGCQLLDKTTEFEDFSSSTVRRNSRLVPKWLKIQLGMSLSA